MWTIIKARKRQNSDIILGEIYLFYFFYLFITLHLFYGHAQMLQIPFVIIRLLAIWESLLRQKLIDQNVVNQRYLGDPTYCNMVIFNPRRC